VIRTSAKVKAESAEFDRIFRNGLKSSGTGVDSVRLSAVWNFIKIGLWLHNCSHETFAQTKNNFIFRHHYFFGHAVRGQTLAETLAQIGVTAFRA